MSSFRYDNSTRSITGQALTGVSVAVLTEPASTTTQPGSPLASIFSAPNSNAPAFTSASWLNGFITFVLGTVPSDVVVGSYLGITGVNPAGYNGIWLVSAVNGLNVQVTNSNGTLILTSPGTYVSGGTVATSVLPNPFLTDQLGNFFFYAAAGIYTVQLYGSALPNQLVLLDQNVVAGGGAGSVTSVALTMPAEFSVAGSPVSTTGTLAVTKANENANLVYAGPATGAPAQPTFRSLVAADGTGVFGTVSSVALTATVPTDIITSAVGGSPVTGSGTLALTLTKVNQNANLVLAGPTSGGASAPTFRALVAGDLPGGVGSGTVTSVALSVIVPSFLNSVISGSPVIAAGTLTDTITLVNQTANQVFAGPTGGAAATPTFRALASADIPDPLTLGVPGTSTGQLLLAGITSGSSSFTAPAIAGTSTNPVTASNVLNGPDGNATHPTYSYTSGPQTGWYYNAGFLTAAQNSNNVLSISNGNGIGIKAGVPIIWGATDALGIFDTSISRESAGIIDIGNGMQGDKSGSLKFTNASMIGVAQLYNNIVTVSNGIPSEYATVDLTSQTAPIIATTLYTPITSGMFRISAYLKITTTGTSPVLGPLTITYTDGTDSVAQSVVMAMQTQAGANTTSNAGNTATSVLTGILVIWAKVGVAIQYAVALTGTIGATQYEVHLKLEAL